MNIPPLLRFLVVHAPSVQHRTAVHASCPISEKRNVGIGVEQVRPIPRARNTAVASTHEMQQLLVCFFQPTMYYFCVLWPHPILMQRSL